MSAIKEILSNPVYDAPVQPELFSKAAGEMIFFVIAMSGVVTWIARPEVYQDNPILTVLGYNSPCVFFDMPPANWFAVPLWSLVVYFNMRFCVLLYQRTLVLDRSVAIDRISFVVSLIYTASTMIVPLTLAVGPHEHWKMHFLAFGQVVPTRFMAVALNYLVFPELVTRSSVVFLIIYAILSVGEFGGIVAAVLFYDNSWGPPVVGNPHVVNPIVQQTIDYLWFGSLPLASVFCPKTPALQFEVKASDVVVDEQQIGLSGADSA